jgi:hypothetical protein
MNSQVKTQPVVFGPDNEPYLGRETVRVFDELIVVCLNINGRVAPHTHQIEKNDLQWAACQIIPSGISLALSIRELVRQGYLYGALVLVRPLAERSMTVLYLHRFPHKLEIWNRGWSHKERPTLAKMFNEIGGEQFPNCGPEITQSNSLTHGDPASSLWNLVTMGDGLPGHAVSKLLTRPDLCDRVCMDSAMWLSVLLGMMTTIFADSLK